MLAKTSDSSDNTSEEGKRGGECTITEKEELLHLEEETNDVLYKEGGYCKGKDCTIPGNYRWIGFKIQHTSMQSNGENGNWTVKLRIIETFICVYPDTRVVLEQEEIL